MAETADPIARLQYLRTQVQTGIEARARAQAVLDQAQGRLTEILTTHGVASVDELAAKVDASRAAAENALALAEQALATS